jgi:hypothetical protein
LLLSLAIHPSTYNGQFKKRTLSRSMRPLSFRLVDDFPFDRLSMRSMTSGSQAKSTFKISLFDDGQQIGTATALSG